MINFDEMSRPDFFHCNYCHQPIPFLYASALHGVILLFGQEDGYYGTVCPKCQKTNLHKSKKEDCGSIKSIFNEMGRAKGFHKDVFRCYSVPHMNERLNNPSDHYTYSAFIDVADYHEKPYQFEDDIQGGYPKMTFENPNASLPEDQDGTAEVALFPARDLTGWYSTFQVGDKAIEPMMELLWLKEETIHALVVQENQTGFKRLPRYIFYDGMIEFIENLCWECKGMSDFCSNFKSYQNILVTPKKHSDFHNNRCFALILEKETDLIANGKIMFESPMLAFMREFREFYEPTTPSETEVESEEKKAKEALPPVHSTTGNGNNQAEWEEELLDDYLSILLEEFITDYVELSRGTTFSRAGVANLALRYAEELYDLGRSPLKRQMLMRNRIGEEKRKVQEAEARVPSLRKIISDHAKINHLKIKLANPRLYQMRNRNYLLVGETGTGKEFFAKAIHEAATRIAKRKDKYLPLNCAGLPEHTIESELFGHKKGAFTDAKEDRIGAYEAVDGGTLFLDEIGELPFPLQAKLLRVTRQGEIQPAGVSKVQKVDVITIFATNRELAQEVEQKTFRKDLYYRINATTFEIPPLRERKSDIPLLVNHFISEFDSEREGETEPLQVTAECMEQLIAYEWPGNITQMENAVENLIAGREAGDRRKIDSEEFFKMIPGTEAKKDEPAKAEVPMTRKSQGRPRVTDEQIRQTMEKLNNNQSATARELGVSSRTIRHHLKSMKDRSPT